MAIKKINYTSRNFADVRAELIEFVKQYYPEIFNDFNDAFEMEYSLIHIDGIEEQGAE